MKPIFFSLRDNLKLMILPDTLAHLDGHAVITETYSVYEDEGFLNDRLLKERENTLHLDNNSDLGYLGTLRFDVPDKLFSYIPGEHKQLQSHEVRELIEWLTEVRGNPALWPR